MTDFNAVDFSKLDQSIENVCLELDRVRAQRDELLAALKGLCRHPGACYDNWCRYQVGHTAACLATRAAIAKAEQT